MTKADDTVAGGAAPADRTGQGGLPVRETPPEQALREFLEAGCDWLWETDEELRFSWLSSNYQVATGIDPVQVKRQLSEINREQIHCHAFLL